LTLIDIMLGCQGKYLRTATARFYKPDEITLLTTSKITHTERFNSQCPPPPPYSQSSVIIILSILMGQAATLYHKVLRTVPHPLTPTIPTVSYYALCAYQPCATVLIGLCSDSCTLQPSTWSQIL